MAIMTVSSTAALNSTLKIAKAGDTILLKGGSYTLTASNLTFASDVTIASADVTKQAVITNIWLKNVTGLTMQDLEFSAATARALNPFRVEKSEDIHFVRLNVHGSLDGKPGNDVNAFLIRDSKNVSVEDSEFQQLFHGISHLNVDHLTIENNVFHDMRTDGIRGGGSDWVTIRDNVFRDFKPNPGDHADAIQFWTSNTTANAHHFVIQDNLIMRGNGAPMQGVFFGNEAKGVYYENVTITGNLMAGTMYHGIDVSSGRGVTIRDNIVQGFSDMKSWIRLENVSGGSVTNNDMNAFLKAAPVTNVAQSGNVLIPQSTDQGAAVWAQWRAEQAIRDGGGPSSLGGSLGAGTEELYVSNESPASPAAGPESAGSIGLDSGSLGFDLATARTLYGDFL